MKILTTADLFSLRKIPRVYQHHKAAGTPTPSIVSASLLWKRRKKLSLPFQGQ
jgi:hypothetical protein